ncbi:hypothetical protein [Arthrobacter castelli]|uniref:hypothetical protein n=1 Tax=Arthrobacter castelli TaxID=271431 RepID=UPI00041C03C7|nr:hypothetical protein [Arthrobacter castelli]
MNNDPFQAPDYASHGRRGTRPGIVLLSVPLGAIAGFILGIAVEMVVGLFAGFAFNAANPGDAAAFMWLASLPGAGALAGAVLAPVLYVATSKRRRK